MRSKLKDITECRALSKMSAHKIQKVIVCSKIKTREKSSFGQNGRFADVSKHFHDTKWSANGFGRVDVCAWCVPYCVSHSIVIVHIPSQQLLAKILRIPNSINHFFFGFSSFFIHIHFIFFSISLSFSVFGSQSIYSLHPYLTFYLSFGVQSMTCANWFSTRAEGDNSRYDFHGALEWWYANHVESKEGHKLKLNYKLEYSYFFFCPFFSLPFAHTQCTTVYMCSLVAVSLHRNERNKNILHTHFASIGCIKVAARAI